MKNQRENVTDKAQIFILLFRPTCFSPSLAPEYNTQSICLWKFGLQCPTSPLLPPRKVPLEDLIYTSCTDSIPQPAAARTPRLYQPSAVHSITCLTPISLLIADVTADFIIADPALALLCQLLIVMTSLLMSSSLIPDLALQSNS
ncbi:hypothetical protein F511_40426 [Dorcoceras hygrometricum]|uniref:Uncharacterized protein n=1 Tax=Dorcoceras hygrometricum TaxID=472368 RepID=A0A2Z7ANY7_9LAMI|nr:hypothetical protein F511_40426 [Dorcoceras hygrometricum]